MKKLEVFSKKLGVPVLAGTGLMGRTIDNQGIMASSGWSDGGWSNGGWSNYGTWMNSGWSNYGTWMNSGWSNYGGK